MSISDKLIKWYEINKRDLPWRLSQDPYIIWLSEIILQQTRVAQGLAYFNKFKIKYPDVTSFANAPIDDILRDWQGLGYYSRARNMHFTAKYVLEKYGNQFPNTYHELILLKGIGEYTAAAIASFSNNENVGVVDGNVLRVFARLFAIENNILDNSTKKIIQKLVNQELPKNNSSTYNQSIMELGALICTPTNPLCDQCPVKSFCKVFDLDIVSKIPLRISNVKKKNRKIIYVVLVNNQGDIALKQRGENDIWQGLNDFYQFEVFIENDEIIDLLQKVEPVKYLHKLTHLNLELSFLIVKVNDYQQNRLKILNPEIEFYSKIEIENLAKPIIIDRFLKDFQLID